MSSACCPTWSAPCPTATPRAHVVADHAGDLLEFLHQHHHGEDELLWPVLTPRVHIEPERVERMAAQHEQVATSVTALQELLPRWRVTAGATDRDAVVAEIDRMTGTLLAHLDEEEHVVLPLVEQHLSCAEWARLAEHGLEQLPKDRRLALRSLGSILEDTDPDERRRFMAALPLPARLAWRLVGRRSYTAHVREVRRHP